MDLSSARRWAIGCGAVVTIGLGGLLLLSMPEDPGARSASETIRIQTGGSATTTRGRLPIPDWIGSLPPGWEVESPFTDRDVGPTGPIAPGSMVTRSPDRRRARPPAGR